MIAEEKLQYIYENVQTGKYEDITPISIEKIKLHEGDLCVFKLFGLSSEDSAKKIDDLDVGSCFKSTNIKYDGVICEINDKGRPSYIALINIQENGEVHRFSPRAPVFKVELYTDLATFTDEGISKPMPGFMVIIDGLAGLLVLNRCIRTKT